MRDLYAARKSGILCISRQNIRKRIHLRKGVAIFADGGDGQAKTREQAELLAYSLFTWTSGDYAFEEGEPDIDDSLAFEGSPSTVILEGSRRIDEVEILKALIVGWRDPFLTHQNVRTSSVHDEALAGGKHHSHVRSRANAVLGDGASASFRRHRHEGVERARRGWTLEDRQKGQPAWAYPRRNAATPGTHCASTPAGTRNARATTGIHPGARSSLAANAAKASTRFGADPRREGSCRTARRERSSGIRRARAATSTHNACATTGIRPGARSSRAAKASTLVGADPRREGFCRTARRERSSSCSRPTSADERRRYERYQRYGTALEHLRGETRWATAIETGRTHSASADSTTSDTAFANAAHGATGTERRATE